MTNTNASYALAVRAHARDGSVDASPRMLARMRSAAAALGESEPRILAGPTGIVGETTLVLQLVSPEAVLPAILALATAVRPERATFCTSAAPVVPGGGGPHADYMTPALSAAHRAATEAVGRLDETDFREARVLVVGPPPAELLGSLIGLILEGHDAMTERQRQIVQLVRESETQQEVAEHLGISRQAVNQSLAAAGWHHIERAEASAVKGLADLWDGAGGRT